MLLGGMVSVFYRAIPKSATPLNRKVYKRHCPNDTFNYIFFILKIFLPSNDVALKSFNVAFDDCDKNHQVRTSICGSKLLYA